MDTFLSKSKIRPCPRLHIKIYISIIYFKPKDLTPIILTAAPSFWGLTLAANSLDCKLLSDVALFSVGAFSMRSFGCIINDIWDSDIDSKVFIFYFVQGCLKKKIDKPWNQNLYIFIQIFQNSNLFFWKSTINFAHDIILARSYFFLKYSMNLWNFFLKLSLAARNLFVFWSPRLCVKSLMTLIQIFRSI